MSRAVMITTTDNPYDPMNEFDDWYKYDISHGYGTSEYLARVAKISSHLGDKLNDEAIEEAINEIIEFNPPSMYKKLVYEDDKLVKS